MARRGLSRWPNRAAVGTITDYSAKIADPVERLRYVRACTLVARQNSRFLRLRPIRPVIYGVLWLGSRFRGRQGERRLASALSGVVACAAAVAIWFGSGERERVMEAAANPESEPSEVAAPHDPPAEIWLVESLDGEDLYSNGLRVDNRYRTHTGPRVYAILPRDGEVEPEALEWRERPVGLVFHTTESDLAPFAKAYNHHIRYQGRQLLLYLQRERLYNFAIDRFGKVYRIVPEEEYAHHAGHSVWAEGGELYVNLNHSFLGVAFETRRGLGPSTDRLDQPLTQAQLARGRLLTALLRQTFAIVEGNVVTHEMVSLNPANGLVGYHTDWRGRFPFSELGLPDNYRLAVPSIAEWGFRYDRQFVDQIGGQVWAGLRLAEKRFQREAERRRISLQRLRKRRVARLREWMERLRELTEQRAEQQVSTGAADATLRARETGGRERIHNPVLGTDKEGASYVKQTNRLKGERARRRHQSNRARKFRRG